ncbi:ankyrin repeat domain-containing protein 10a [Aulostomus maculatus]
MSEGLEPEFSSDEAFTRRFPIHRACRDGDVGALVALLQHLQSLSPLTTEDCYGWTPIHWAAHHGQLECVMRLVQMGCDVNTVTSRFNQTPTHTAAFGGHPHCLVWLTQAGADVNRQDFVGEAPIHKAARSGSLECIQVLLIAGAEPHLRNASGQTAADLAKTHASRDCFHFICDAQKHLLQLNELHVNGVQNGNGAPCGQGLLSRVASRKRLLAASENGHMKKARGDVCVQMQSSGVEEPDSMNMDPDTKAITNGHQQLPPAQQDDGASLTSVSTRDREASPPASQRASADMCGSLHLTGSPSSCVSHRPAWWGLLGADNGDHLHYGYYHGFGDTAEELTGSSRLDYNSSIQAEQRYNQAMSSNIHLYHGS